MHEMAIAENIMQIIENRLNQSGQKAQVTRVNLRVGKLTNVEPEALRLSFEAISRDTPLEKATLCIDSVPVRGKCEDCGKNFGLSESDFACPSCGSFRMVIETGRELFVESFEIE
jgi:hydrogenase nickel incorporation protein HypA/HybF